MTRREKITVHTTHARVNSQRQRITTVEHNVERLANEYTNIEQFEELKERVKEYQLQKLVS